MLGIQAELLKIYGFWGALLGIKLFLMVPLTGFHRFRKRIFMNPEDLKFGSKGAKVNLNDPDVERVRRAHLNDLENILPWYFLTAIWLTTNPSVWLASILIPTFVIARYVHTIVYAVIPQQPARAIAFFVGFGISLYQTISTLMHYL